MIAMCAGNQPLTCKAWSDISPAVKAGSQGAFLSLKSDDAVAVKFSSGVLFISVAKGSIQHATFLPGDYQTICFVTELKAQETVQCNTVQCIAVLTSMHTLCLQHSWQS